MATFFLSLVVLIIVLAILNTLVSPLVGPRWMAIINAVAGLFFLVYVLGFFGFIPVTTFGRYR